MQFATSKEIEYLSSMDGKGHDDATLMREMSRRLDALRRFDQHICKADWRPRRTSDGQPSKGRFH